MLNHYMINEKTVLITGQFNEFGRLCTMIIEGGKRLVVDMPPVSVINNTLLMMGSDFRGALNSSKEILGERRMYPIKVNSELEIWLLPTKSYKDPHCVWFSLMHIQKTKPLGSRKTDIQLSYDHSFELSMRESSFNNKRQRAKELRETIIKNTKNPISFYLEPKTGFRISEDDGVNRYRVSGEEDKDEIK